MVSKSGDVWWGFFVFVFLNTKINSQSTNTLTLSSTISMENSLPSPRELLHVRMELLLVTRARIVHLLQKRQIWAYRFRILHFSGTLWAQMSAPHTCRDSCTWYCDLLNICPLEDLCINITEQQHHQTRLIYLLLLQQVFHRHFDYHLERK